MNNIKHMLDYLKSEYGMTQRFVAKKLGVTDKYLSDCKNGHQRASEILVDKLRELYISNGGK